MSRASDYARDTAAILQNRANAIAEGKRTSGAIIGQTVATLGAQIPQAVQQVIKANAEKRKKEQIQGIFQKYPGDLDSAINELMPLDQELGNELLKRHTEAKKTALEFQSVQATAKAAQQKAQQQAAEFEAQQLGAATDQDSHIQALLNLQTAGFDISKYDPTFNPSRAKQLRRSRMTGEQLYAEDNPKATDTGPLVPVVGPDGKSIYGTRTQAIGTQIPTDTTKEKTYQVTVPGPNGPITRLATEEEMRAGVQTYRAPTGDGTPDVALALTPAGLDQAARRYLADGTMPAMGMGSQAASARARILNRAAEIDPNASIAGNKADYRADAGSLAQLTKQKDAITSFENTAKKNIDVFLKTAEKVVDTGSPLANSVARVVSGKVLGSPDQAAYDAARQVAINEVAKIITNPNLSGQLSDAARHEVEAFNPQNATLKQSVRVMRLLKQDMDNRTKALDDQIASIRGRLGSGQRPAAPAVGGADPLGIR